MTWNAMYACLEWSSEVVCKQCLLCLCYSWGVCMSSVPAVCLVQVEGGGGNTLVLKTAQSCRGVKG